MLCAYCFAMKLLCCDSVIEKNDTWLLKDIRDFKDRKIITAICPICHKPIIVLSEKRISDSQVFFDTHYGDDALKVIKKESKRLISQYFKVDTQFIHGWLYGINKEIKNKKGDVVQVRQYASDFNNNRTLIKKIFNKKQYRIIYTNQIILKFT